MAVQNPATVQMVQDIRKGLIPVGKAVEADNATSADNDGEGNNIASTYAKGTMVPVRSAYGPYFTVVGSLPFKAGDIAIVIDNSNNTNYEIGGLYKITGESGGTGGGLAILQDTSVGNFFSAGVKGQYQQLSDGTYNLIINIEQ